MRELRQCVIEYVEFLKCDQSIGDKLLLGFSILYYGSFAIFSRLFMSALILSQITTE